MLLHPRVPSEWVARFGCDTNGHLARLRIRGNLPNQKCALNILLIISADLTLSFKQFKN